MSNHINISLEESVKRLTSMRKFGERRRSADVRPETPKVKPLETSRKLFNLKYATTIAKALDNFPGEKLNANELQIMLNSLSLELPKNLYVEIWELLDCEKRQGALKQAIYEILLAILGINHKIDNEQPIKIPAIPIQKPFGKYDETNLENPYKLNMEEKLILYLKYGKDIRSTNLAKRSNSQAILDQLPEFTYSPKTNKVSEKMAWMARNKVLNKVGRTVKNASQTSVEDLLLMHKQIYENKVKIKKKESENAYKKHSYKPKLNNRQMSPQPGLIHGTVKWLEKKKSEKTIPSDEYYYKKDPEAFTFRPKINQYFSF